MASADDATSRSRKRPWSEPPVQILVHDAGFEIDEAFAQRRAVLVRLLHEVQAHARGLGANTREEAASEALDEAVAGPQGEGARQAQQSIGSGRSTASPPRPVADPLLQATARRGGHESPPRPDQQWIARRLPRRAKARLIAEGLSRSRLAAPATLPSASSTSRVKQVRSPGGMASLAPPPYERLMQCYVQTVRVPPCLTGLGLSNITERKRHEDSAQTFIAASAAAGDR